MNTRSSDSLSTEVLIAGDFGTIRQVCREFAAKFHICLCPSPIEFVYDYGCEHGASVRLLNSPRNLKTEKEMLSLGDVLANKLMDQCVQKSAIVLNSGRTILIERS